MGNVYLAQDLKLASKKWAIKECELNGFQANQFAEEARMLAKINHPKLPHIVDYVTSPNNLYGYLVMEYIEGPTLQDLFQDKNFKVEVIDVIRITLQICDIFRYLHSFKPYPIIYRDLKPSNIMIDKQKQIRLIDFGIARHFSLEKNEDTMQLGTIGFAAPEQFLGKQTNAYSDIYAIGALVYYLLSDGIFAYRRRMKLHELREDVSKEFSLLVEKLLAENPEQRFTSVTFLKQELESMFLLKNNYQVDGNQYYQSKIQSLALETPRLVVIGGLYHGVGSTFISLSLARYLHAKSLPHALIEHPTNEPDLYTLLFGERFAPDSYCFISEIIKSGAKFSQLKQWEKGYSTWIPISPRGFVNDWNVEDTFQLLFNIKKPIMIWDISTNWHEPSSHKLCEIADEIIIVVDASPGKIMRPSSQITLNLIDEYRSNGKSIQFIANREQSTNHNLVWTSCLPQLPISYCPEFPSQHINKAVAHGKFIQDDIDVLNKLQITFAPIYQKMHSENSPHPKHKKGWARFKKWIGFHE